MASEKMSDETQGSPSVIIIRAVLLFYCLVFYPSASVGETEAPVFTMAFGHHPDDNPQYLFYQRLYTEAFRELGYRFEYKVYPSKRSSLYANKGYVDGEPQRIFKYGEIHKNMVRVEEPVFVNRTIATVTNPGISLSGLKSLEHTDYRVDYIRGSVWSQNHLQPLIKPEHLHSIGTEEQAFKRLLTHRTDVFIGLEVRILEQLSTPEFKDSGIVIAGVIGENYSYPFVHQSHQTLAVQLADVLRAMKIDGRFDEILYRSLPFLSLQRPVTAE